MLASSGEGGATTAQNGWFMRRLQDQFFCPVFRFFEVTKWVAYARSMLFSPDFEKRSELFLPFPHDVYPVQLGLRFPFRLARRTVFTMKLILLRLTLMTRSR